MSEVSAEHEPEKTLWRGSVSNWHYAGKWLLVLLLLAGCVASFFLSFALPMEVIWGVRAALVVVAMLLIIRIQIDRAGRKYMVTNRRVSAEFGLVSRESNEIRVHDIRSINLRQTGVKGLLGIGTIEFSSAATDDADIIFWNVPGAEKLRDLVRSLQA